jgi:hypothetical protein
VPRDGIVIVPAKEWEQKEQARDARCRVAVFAGDDRITMRDKKLARAAAWVRDGRIAIEWLGEVSDGGPLAPGIAPGAQVAAALAERTLCEMDAAAAAEASAEAARPVPSEPRAR